MCQQNLKDSKKDTKQDTENWTSKKSLYYMEDLARQAEEGEQGKIYKITRQI
jgi:hypothetical protein